MSAPALSDLKLRLQSLAVFRALLEDPVVAALCRYLDCLDGSPTADAVSAYSGFVAALYATEKRTLAGHVQSIVWHDENAYIRMTGKGVQPWPEMEADVLAELKVLQAVADLTPEALREGIAWNGYLPKFPVKEVDITGSYRQRVENIGQYGYGIYAKYHMFYIGANSAIVPVRSPDPIRLSDLVDYKREQDIILHNTIALLEGRPAANILLTGDAGTGKSSTIKAVVNELHPRGFVFWRSGRNSSGRSPPSWTSSAPTR